MPNLKTDLTNCTAYFKPQIFSKSGHLPKSSGKTVSFIHYLTLLIKSQLYDKRLENTTIKTKNMKLFANKVRFRLKNKMKIWPHQETILKNLYLSIFPGSETELYICSINRGNISLVDNINMKQRNTIVFFLYKSPPCNSNRGK